MITPILMFSFILINARPKRFGLYPSSSATLRTPFFYFWTNFPCYSIHGQPFLWKLLILLQFVELLLSYLSPSVMTRALFILPPVHPESSRLSSVHFVLPATSQTIHLYSLLLPSQGSDSVMLFLSVNTTSINLRSSLLT